MADPSLHPLPPAGVSGGATYGLEELLEVAGSHLEEEISPRTVRLYATQGLIDRPGKEGRSAVYGHRHLLQLLLIRSLARRGLSLAAIAPLCGLADRELEQQLAQLEAPTATSQPGREEALAYLRHLQGPAPAGLEDSDPSNGSGSLLPLLGSPLPSLSSGRPPSPSRPRSHSRSSGSRDAASRWHRFTLAPGVELHISEAVSIPPAGSRRLAWLRRLTDRLLELLDDRPS